MDSVIKEYNSLLCKDQSTPYIIPKSLRFLENINQISNNYFILPLLNNINHIIYISKHGVFLLNKYSIEKINTDISEKTQFLSNTIISGTILYDIFIGYDLAFYQSKDMRKRSYKTRRKLLHSVSKFCPLIKLTSCIPVDNMSDENYYETLIFLPNNANYTNNHTFIYKTVENVGINFKLTLKSISNYNLYILHLKNNIFKGTPEFPYGPIIPLSKIDRDIIGDINDNIIEFRWENNAFLPYQTKKNTVSTNYYANMAWNYINNPIELNTLKYHISTFKKK